MKVYIAGICGTFMAGIAQIARAMGAEVTGCDQNVYPPMSSVLGDLGIEVQPGYDPAHLPTDCDVVIIGNALSRGNPLVEHVLSEQIPFTSGPQWLGEQVLRRRKVIAVAGTHGKTSTASMVTWILECAGYQPGFLIGGKPGNFEETARLGGGEWFVIEADEYDTAFFDKRSKFVHYFSDIAILNNLEFDHADIFDDLNDIERQFHHLVRTVPAQGTLVVNADDANLQSVTAMGVWSDTTSFSCSDPTCDWYASARNTAASRISVQRFGAPGGLIDWDCIGEHNMQNALAAVAAAGIAGVPSNQACEALARFSPTARRLQRRLSNKQAVLYEDFAHHPTAIQLTLEAVRSAHPGRRLIAIIEPRSNTMQMAVHVAAMARAIEPADEAIFYTPHGLDWHPAELDSVTPIHSFSDPGELVSTLVADQTKPVAVVAMSNGSFDGLPGMIQEALTRAS